MKNIGIFCLFMMFSFGLMGQNLSVEQMLSLSKKDLGLVEDYLSGKNWFFYTGSDETEENYGNVKFVHDRPNYKVGDPAIFYITYYFSEAERAQGVMMRFRSEEAFNNYINQMRELGFDLKESSTDDGDILKIYSNGRYIIEVTVPPNFDGGKSYAFTFATKKSYRRMHKD
ncbi:hypothetical protein MG296_07465 [Flavobacteriaceae bacterium TK19130]|nr:hypothetical protein [Thermobacterium salinum]